jgi:hypothetical protein
LLAEARAGDVQLPEVTERDAPVQLWMAAILQVVDRNRVHDTGLVVGVDRDGGAAGVAAFHRHVGVAVAARQVIDDH